MSGPSMRRNSRTSSGTRSRWSSQTLYGDGTSLRPSMFEIEARGGLGRKGVWTRGDLALTTPLVLFVHYGSRAAPSYAEGLIVAERTGDPRFQIRVGGSFFAPQPPTDPDDLPPSKGTPRSLADLEIPQETVSGEWAVVAGESGLRARRRARPSSPTRTGRYPARCCSSGITWSTVASASSWSDASRTLPGTRRSCVIWICGNTAWSKPIRR